MCRLFELVGVVLLVVNIEVFVGVVDGTGVALQIVVPPSIVLLSPARSSRRSLVLIALNLSHFARSTSGEIAVQSSKLSLHLFYCTAQLHSKSFKALKS